MAHFSIILLLLLQYKHKPTLLNADIGGGWLWSQCTLWFSLVLHTSHWYHFILCTRFLFIY